jgi:hypothetical protein
VSDASRHDNDESAGLVLTFEELAEAIKHAPPPTDDDVSITWDGRAINSKEKLLAILQEVEASRKAGVTFEELRQRPGAWGKNGNWTVDWHWDPVTDPPSLTSPASPPSASVRHRSFITCRVSMFLCFQDKWEARHMVSSRLEGVERVLLEQNPWLTNGVPLHLSEH